MGSGFVNKVLDVLGLADEIEENNDNESDTADKTESGLLPSIRIKKENAVNIHSKPKIKVVVSKMMEYEEVIAVSSHLKDKRVVILNLSEMKSDITCRCVDFLSGVIHAIDGDIREISPGILLLAPQNVEVSSELKNELNDMIEFPMEYRRSV